MYGHKRAKQEQGQFTKANADEDKRLLDLVEFRVTALDWRRLMILFEHHRLQFNCELKSDMFRYVMRRGLSATEGEVHNPSDEMEDLRLQSDGVERAASSARRHTVLDMMLNRIDEDVHLLMQAGDLGAIRSVLLDFKKQTGSIKDSVIRARRGIEFDRRWGRLYEGLNRNASLDPRSFEEDK